ncbi:MAG: hemin uptake protein HemP [Pirellulales bacterium]
MSISEIPSVAAPAVLPVSPAVATAEVAEAATPVESNVALPTAVRMLLSQDLFAGSREVCIAHRGALYRLRITMQNRLILQK